MSQRGLICIVLMETFLFHFYITDAFARNKYYICQPHIITRGMGMEGMTRLREVG